MILVSDDTVPVITCPDSTTQLVSDDTPQLVEFVGALEATATDNLLTTITYDPPSLTVDSSNVGQSFLVTANATDSDGNWQSCIFMVYVQGTHLS